MKHIVSSDWLQLHLNDRNIRIADCRFSLSDPAKGYAAYLKDHLPGAVYFDLEKDLSSPVGIHGGRHPLPDFAELAGKLETAGFHNDDIVVAYDDGDGAFAARLWWLLSYMGHEKVYVLDGGMHNWKAKGLPVTSSIPDNKKGRYTVSLQEEWIAGIEEVKALVHDKGTGRILVDSREEKRYQGLEEPIDKKAGHIPGAINKPWFEGLEAGFYKSAEEQQQRFADIDPAKEVIVYCGSGVTATPNFLALKEAGYEHVKLYAGSFSDWISYNENKIEP